MNNLSNEDVNLLRYNARSVIRELGLLNDAYFDIGVTLAERHLLIELSSCLYPTVGDIAERLLLDKSTASRLIAKAVKRDMSNIPPMKMIKENDFLSLPRLEKRFSTPLSPLHLIKPRKLFSL